MPTHRDPVINLPSIHKRPTALVDSLGNVIGNGPDAPVTETTSDGSCLAGVIPTTLRRSPYLVLAGQTGDINTRRWLVAVIGAPTLAEGDLVTVTQGQQPGNYRAEVVNPTPPGEQIVLAQCLRE